MLKSYKITNMSFDAENRSNNFPTIYSTRTYSGTSRCSFCNVVGHNIRRCTDTRIIEFEQECRMSRSFCVWTVEPRNTFKEWLMEYYLIVNSEVVKAFAISRCSCRMFSNIDVIIDSIINYIYEEEEEEVLDNDSLQEVYNILLRLQTPNYTNIENSAKKFNIARNVEQLEEQQCEEKCECAICYEESIPKKHSITLNCKHQFCKDCFKGCLKSTPVNKDLPSCALCRADISEITVCSESVKSELDDYLTD